MVDHGLVELESVSDDLVPEGFSDGGKESISPEGLEERVSDGESEENRVLVLGRGFEALAPLFDFFLEEAFLFGLFGFVVPVLVPVGKNFTMPNFL